MTRNWLLVAGTLITGLFHCSGASSPADGATATQDGSMSTRFDATSPDVATSDSVLLPDHNVTQTRGCPTDSGLPCLPQLTNVVAVQREDSVGIDFDPVDGAIDYRVYVVPNPSDVTAHNDGSITVRNAVYRCAGLRQTWDLPTNLNGSDPSIYPYAAENSWRSQILPNPTMGYVYVTPGADRVPVYVVAGYTRTWPSELGWQESRLKIYTTDSHERDMRLSQRWRDDGIAFYVPANAGSGTHTVYTSESTRDQTVHERYYFLQADMSSHMTDTTAPTAAFQVLTASAPDTQPLMATLYQNDQRHVELSAGNARYQRALHQGSGPLWHLEWAGITQPTTLVVEALSSGCPYQGLLAARHLDAPPHQTFYALSELQSQSPTGEAFINGQYDNATSSPIPIARSFIQVSPQPHDPSQWDWYEGFTPGTDFGPVTQVEPFTWSGGHAQTAQLDIGAYSLDAPSDVTVFTFGSFQGQMWEAFDDTGSGVTGRVRFAARQMASVSADTFLHVTMSVNIVSTDRRYPQIIVSDQPAPVDCFGNNCAGGFSNGLGTATSNSLLIQNIQGPDMRLETQAFHGLVNGQAWNVNNQAPEHRFLDTMEHADLNPVANSIFEHAGVDRMTRYDAFVSSQRLYVFIDGAPAGCTQYPSGFSIAGPVSVTFGDVLYHEAVTDEGVCMQSKPFDFLHRHQCTETSRHFDDLGFKSAVPAPMWDETRFPCEMY